MGMISPGLGTLSFYGKYGESFSVVMLELMGGGPPNRVAGEQATKQSSRTYVLADPPRIASYSFPIRP